MFVAAGVSACLWACIAPAADDQGNYAIWGAGARSCNHFALAAQNESELSSFRDYLMGYLTAFNTLTPDTYDATGGETLEKSLLWLRRYCSEHKMDSFERALGQLLLTQHEQRSRMSPGRSQGWGGRTSQSAPP